MKFCLYPLLLGVVLFIGRLQANPFEVIDLKEILEKSDLPQSIKRSSKSPYVISINNNEVLIRCEGDCYFVWNFVNQTAETIYSPPSAEVSYIKMNDDRTMIGSLAGWPVVWDRQNYLQIVDLENQIQDLKEKCKVKLVDINSKGQVVGFRYESWEDFGEEIVAQETVVFVWENGEIKDLKLHDKLEKMGFDVIGVRPLAINDKGAILGFFADYGLDCDSYSTALSHFQNYYDFLNGVRYNDEKYYYFIYENGLIKIFVLSSYVRAKDFNIHNEVLISKDKKLIFIFDQKEPGTYVFSDENEISFISANDSSIRMNDRKQILFAKEERNKDYRTERYRYILLSNNKEIDLTQLMYEIGIDIKLTISKPPDIFMNNEMILIAKNDGISFDFVKINLLELTQ